MKSTPPCENSCVTDDIATPLPMLCAPTANTSANSERDALKPVVFALAMLLAVTERSDDAAFRPLKATANGMATVLW